MKRVIEITVGILFLFIWLLPVQADRQKSIDLQCAAGEIPKSDGTTWQCAADDTGMDTNAATLCTPGQYLDGDGTCQSVPVNTDRLAGLNCSEGQVPVFVSGQWQCGTLSDGQNTPRFVDNGDGTITDTKTGLMWEKKFAADDIDNHCNETAQFDRDIHCVNNLYARDPGLTARESVTDFIHKLNDFSNPNDGNSTTCFADYCDWDVPTIGELRGILTEPFDLCSTSPCIDSTFGPTGFGGLIPYWSSTAYLTDAAWTVDFETAYVDRNFDTSFFYVRAVRGGRGR